MEKINKTLEDNISKISQTTNMGFKLKLIKESEESYHQGIKLLEQYKKTIDSYTPSLNQLQDLNNALNSLEDDVTEFESKNLDLSVLDYVKIMNQICSIEEYLKNLDKDSSMIIL